MSIQQVHSKGIFHGLPVFPDSVKGLTAIVTGANGISGYHMVRVLAEAPERWSKIYCLSRRPPAIPGGLPKNAEFISCDFMKSPEEIGKVLKDKGVKADYVFFYSYIQVAPKEGAGLWSDAEEMTRVNSRSTTDFAELLTNFLGALLVAGIKPKRFMLQTGAKNYGLHLGPVKQPQEEDDPRVNIESNFYYPQEDALWEFCKQQGIGWTVGRPSNILGAVPDAAMNLCFPLAVYATVTSHLKQKLEWPGTLQSWDAFQTQSSAMMDAYLEEWSVLEERAGNQAFNCGDGSAFTWGGFWPKLAKAYGVEYGTPELDESKLTAVPTRYKTPPRGFAPPDAQMKFKFTLTEWAQRPDVTKAWSEIVEKHDLKEKTLREPERIFGFADGSLLMGYSTAINFSTTKARKLGFHGYVDSGECMFEVFNDFAKLKMIPPVANDPLKG